MVCFDDDALADRALLLRRWGRRSEVQLFGSQKGVERPVLQHHRRRHRVRQPVHLRRGRLELRAVGAVRGLRARAARQARREPRPAAAQLRAAPAPHFARWPELFTLPRLTEGVETGWHMFPLLINAELGHPRGPSCSSGWRATASTPAWCGPATRPASRRSATGRTGVPAGGLPNADRVMECGLVLPNNHSLTDDDCDYIGECLEGFLAEQGARMTDRVRRRRSPGGAPWSPVRAGASAPPSPSGSPPRAPTSRSPPAPWTHHDHLAGQPDARRRSASVRYGATGGHGRRRPHRRGRPRPHRPRGGRRRSAARSTSS